MKLNKKYLAPICSLFVTGGLLITIAVLTLGSSFGWFSNNDKVSASGISVSSVSPYQTSQVMCQLVNGSLVPMDGTTLDVLSGMVPGNTQTAYVRIENQELAALNMELLLSAPREGVSDTVVTETVDGTTNYYYFGSQIRVTSIHTCNVSGTASGNDLRIVHGKDAFLLTMPDSFYTGDDKTSDEVKQGVGVTAEYDFSTAAQKKLTRAITVPAATKDADTGDVTPGVIYLAIDFQFAENGQEQNPYIEFGTGNSSGTLSRQLLCWYSEGN